MSEKPLTAPTAEVVAIGDELTSGLTQDSNSTTLARRLLETGVEMRRSTMVGDDAQAIGEAARSAVERADIVIVTGGLGATHDDITKRVLTELFGNGAYRHDARVQEMIETIYRARGQSVPEYCLQQCRVPASAEILYNEKGTAPGLLFHVSGRRVYCLPGVPLEMNHLLEKYILPELAGRGLPRVMHRMLHTTGIAESGLWEKFGNMEELEKLARVASLPSHLGVKIRLTVRGEEGDNLARLEAAERLLRDKVGEWIYARDEETMEGVVGDLLRRKKLTLAVAESCTGGIIGGRLTGVAGSSDYFIESAVVYANEAKIRRLGVPRETLERFGAVSAETAAAMARGVRMTAKVDIGLSVTGIAGPSGGSADKPVGLTFIGFSDAGGDSAEKFLFHQDRQLNRERAAQAALNLLRRRLRDKR